MIIQNLPFSDFKKDKPRIDFVPISSAEENPLSVLYSIYQGGFHEAVGSPFFFCSIGISQVFLHLSYHHNNVTVEIDYYYHMVFLRLISVF